jgi:ABC-type molybdate transport system substrate-binding protein
MVEKARTRWTKACCNVRNAMSKVGRLLLACATAPAIVGGAQAAEIKILGDGPLRPALEAIAENFRRQTGHTVAASLAASPVIHKRVLDGEVADVLIVQPDFIKELVKARKVPATIR